MGAAAAGALAAAAVAAPQAPQGMAGSQDPSHQAAEAEAPQAGPAPRLAAGRAGEAIDVTVVNVDVVVRDRDGHQVSGLHREDFTLLVDGKKMPLSNFWAAADGGAGADGDTAAQAGAAAPPAATDATAAMNAVGEGGQNAAGGGPGRQRLNLALFVDNAHLRPFDRNRLIAQVRQFLQKTVAPGDRVLVVTHDPGLHVRHAFTESLAALPAVLDQLEKQAPSGLGRESAKRQAVIEMVNDIMDDGCKAGLTEAQNVAKTQADVDLSNARAMYADLHHVVKALGGVEGQRALVYIGDGVPTMVGTDLFGLLGEQCQTADGQRAANEAINATAPLQQVIADANANLVTFFPLEAAGLQSAYASAGASGEPLQSAALIQQVDLDRQDSLLNLGRETGGRAVLAGGDLADGLATIGAELRGSYSLGFTPLPVPWSERHQIRVQIGRPGLTATYRTSYWDRTPTERMEAQVESALLSGVAENPFGASLQIGAGQAAEHGRVVMPVKVRVPFRQLALVPGEDGALHGRLGIIGAAIDEHGDVSPMQRIWLPLRIAQADAQHTLASQLGYDIKLLLAPGRQRLAFALRDEVAHTAACIVQDLDVAKTGTSAAAAPSAPAGGGAH